MSQVGKVKPSARNKVGEQSISVSNECYILKRNGSLTMVDRWNKPRNTWKSATVALQPLVLNMVNLNVKV